MIYRALASIGVFGFYGLFAAFVYDCFDHMHSTAAQIGFYSYMTMWSAALVGTLIGIWRMK